MSTQDVRAIFWKACFANPTISRKRQLDRKPMPASSLNRHTFGEIARFVDVATERDGEMVGEKLERDDSENGHQAVWDVWQRDNFVRDSLELLRTVATGEHDEGAFAGFDLLDVV